MFNCVSNVMLSSSADNSIILWDIRTNKAIYKILAHPEPITAIDISPDSTLILSSSYDGLVRFWDMVKGTCLKTMMAESGSNFAVSDCKFAPNGKYFLISSMNEKLGLYNYENEQLKSYTGKQNNNLAIEAKIVKDSQGQSVVMSGSEDGRLITWDLNSQEVAKEETVPGEKGGAVCSFAAKDGLIAFSGDFEGVRVVRQ